ncbi:hypothetical protein AB4865_04745 [Capnocytophaga sp. ARDL2]|uniref:hypothetical protein n=1 Tax=Capnocytophaga sp. ARDL2 TaxID=3238809 RepID=UPI0035581322
MSSQQVKSKQRVADHGEVFTNEREVKAMVDLVWENFTNDAQKIEATFLEPACGSGNFLVEILNRKLAFVKKEKSRIEYEKSLIKAVCSIYGVELLEDNAQECRERLFQLIKKAYLKKYQDEDRYPKMLQSMQYILHTNIICGNAMDYTTTDGEAIEFTDWKLQSDGMVIRNFFDFRKLNNKKGGMESLFSELMKPDPPPPMHYLEIGVTAP